MLGLQVREALAALRAFPEAIAFVFRVNLGKVHGCLIVRTKDPRGLLLNPVPLLGSDKVPVERVVTNRTVQFRADIPRFCFHQVIFVEHHIGEMHHFSEMFIAKWLQFWGHLYTPRDWRGREIAPSKKGLTGPFLIGAEGNYLSRNSGLLLT